MRSLITTLLAFIALQHSLYGGEIAAIQTAALMPVPEKITYAAEATPLSVGNTFSIALTNAVANDARIRAAATRLLQRWATRTGLMFDALTPEGGVSVVSEKNTDSATLLLVANAAGPAIPALGEDESYTLEVTATQAVLRAPTTTGILRGLATLTQLLQQDANGFNLPAVSITDAPRFSWRGLMVDVVRHWQPIDVIKRELDGMELVKLNVLHLHLCDDQGFRVESLTHPELQQKGSDGYFFTQAQIREIVAYAAARGIRVIPEFDIPGHASCWAVSHPELISGLPRSAGSAPTEDAPEAVGTGAYQIERTWGIFDTVLDPTNEAVYILLGEFFGEMAALFPDPYLHIGGDENNGAQWNASAKIQTFIKQHDLKNNAGIHAYFNSRIGKILQSHGKKIQGWDEILHPTLAPGSLVQSWRGPEGVQAAVEAGFDVILSNGFYIDLNFTASGHYLNDPLPADTPLAPEQKKHVLGGEATMWSEWTPPDIIDSRIWPRAAAVAERLWSPQNIRDVADMYRRLAVVSLRLDEAGLQHIRNRTSLFLRLAGDRATPAQVAALRAFSEATEPVKRYQRGRLQRWSNQLTPLGGFIDATVPDSGSAREFNENAASFLAAAPASPERATLLAVLRIRLQTWDDDARIVAGPLAAQSPRLKYAAEMAEGFIKSIAVVNAALAALENGKPKDAVWLKESNDAIDAATKPNAAAVEFPAVRGIKQLISAAAGTAGENLK